jgi:hypothetical protein
LVINTSDGVGYALKAFSSKAFVTHDQRDGWFCTVFPKTTKELQGITTIPKDHPSAPGNYNFYKAHQRATKNPNFHKDIQRHTKQLGAPRMLWESSYCLDCSRTKVLFPDVFPHFNHTRDFDNEIDEDVVDNDTTLESRSTVSNDNDDRVVAPTMEASPSNTTQICNQVDETVIQVQEDISEIDLDDGSMP